MESPEDTNKQELYQIHFKVESFSLKNPSKTKKTFTITYRLPNSQHVKDVVQMNRDETLFSPGKIILLPFLPDYPHWLQAELSLSDGKTELATTFIPNIITENLATSTNETYNLFDTNNESIGTIGIKITGTRMGPSFAQMLDKDGNPIIPRPVKEFRYFDSAFNKPKPIETDKLVLHTPKNSKNKNGLILELIAPRAQMTRIIPPHHEDVGVQVDLTAKRTKNSKSIKKF